ncbi:unnamed protein product [Lupinus luteus]|uniref:Uncharacterized protein n=1 Tax=Lupinus luteus TaxID=3873 RepID=A0AAV1YHX7_LUPLU
MELAFNHNHHDFNLTYTHHHKGRKDNEESLNFPPPGTEVYHTGNLTHGHVSQDFNHSTLLSHPPQPYPYCSPRLSRILFHPGYPDIPATRVDLFFNGPRIGRDQLRGLNMFITFDRAYKENIFKYLCRRAQVNLNSNNQQGILARL